MVELMRQRRAVGADRWFVQHTYAHEDAKRLAERLAELFGSEPGVHLRGRTGMRNQRRSGGVVGRRSSRGGVGVAVRGEVASDSQHRAAGP